MGLRTSPWIKEISSNIVTRQASPLFLLPPKFSEYIRKRDLASSELICTYLKKYIIVALLFGEPRRIKNFPLLRILLPILSTLDMQIIKKKL